MNKIFSSLKNKLSRKDGMTLVEVLVAMSILMLIIFTFTPLFANYYRNIYKAGEVTKNTYNKASIMERLFANRDGSNNAAYDTEVNNVPLELFAKTEAGTTVSSITFGTTGSDVGTVNGRLITTDGSKHGGTNEYASFYTSNAGNDMVCFPKSLTDDFIETKVMVLPIGFSFRKNFSENLFTVKYTNQRGERVGADQTPTYYDVEIIGTGEDAYAEFTFKGANDVICFQNSPLEIYYSGEGGHSVLVEIGAPEIIMVGEKTQDNKYFYYATAGVDVDTGHIDLIAKDMKSKTDNAADLNAAMNDVEWVSPGEGNDENGNPTEYGYYVMGGDNGQVRRFWRNETTGNYYWGGDYLVPFKSYTDTETNKKYTSELVSFTNKTKGKSAYSQTFKSELSTTASYEVFYGADNWPNHAFQLNDYETTVLFVGTGKFAMYQGSFGTVTAKSGYNGIVPNFYYGGNTRYNRDSNIIKNNSHYRDNALKATFGTGTDAVQDSYQTFIGDTTPTPITITSVGAVTLTADDKSAYLSSQPYAGAYYKYNDQSIKYNSVLVDNVEAYPQTSYTLYCGTIPAYVTLYGYYFANKPTEMLHYVATLGIGYDKDTNTYGLTGKFADKNTGTITLNGKDYASTDLCRYIDQGIKTGDIGKGSSKSITPGALISDYYQDVSITGKKVVDISIGYLSQPYANSNAPLATHYGENSDEYLDSKAGDSNFYSAASREFSTFLDIASYHDDYRDATFSVGVGYGLGIFGRDARGYNRIGQVYNIGTIYLRASGDGSSTATALKHSAAGTQSVTDSVSNQTFSGRGWSMRLESNVFHPFYGIDQYAQGDYLKLDDSLQKVNYDAEQQSCKGWNDDYHHQWMTYVPPGSIFSSGGDKGSEEGNQPSHILSQTKCTTVAIGSNPNDHVEIMVGTENGTVMSWYYDYNTSNVNNETSHAMKKEFENYTWAERMLLFGKITSYIPYVAYGGNYDYWSTLDNKGATKSDYSFISSLEKINDIKFGDDYWVVAGVQGTRTPKQTGSGSKAYTSGGGTGSYLNVRYYDVSANRLAWKAVKFSETENVNIISIEYCQGIWYAVGYIDSNVNGEPDSNEKGVIYYATNPLETAYDDAATGGSYYVGTYNGGWRRCITSQGIDEEGNPVYSNNGAENTYVLYYKGGSCVTRTLTGVNSAASQE